MSLKKELEVKKERLIGVIVEGGVFGEEFAREWVDHIVALSQGVVLEDQGERSYEQLKSVLQIVFPADRF